MSLGRPTINELIDKMEIKLKDKVTDPLVRQVVAKIFVEEKVELKSAAHLDQLNGENPDDNAIGTWLQKLNLQANEAKVRRFIRADIPLLHQANQQEAKRIIDVITTVYIPQMSPLIQTEAKNALANPTAERLLTAVLKNYPTLKKSAPDEGPETALLNMTRDVLSGENNAFMLIPEFSKYPGYQEFIGKVDRIHTLLRGEQKYERKEDKKRDEDDVRERKERKEEKKYDTSPNSLQASIDKLEKAFEYIDEIKDDITQANLRMAKKAFDQVKQRASKENEKFIEEMLARIQAEFIVNDVIENQKSNETKRELNYIRSELAGLVMFSAPSLTTDTLQHLLQPYLLQEEKKGEGDILDNFLLNEPEKNANALKDKLQGLAPGATDETYRLIANKLFYLKHLDNRNPSAEQKQAYGFLNPATQLEYEYKKLRAQLEGAKTELRQVLRKSPSDPLPPDTAKMLDELRRKLNVAWELISPIKNKCERILGGESKGNVDLAKREEEWNENLEHAKTLYLEAIQEGIEKIKIYVDAYKKLRFDHAKLKRRYATKKDTLDESAVREADAIDKMAIAQARLINLNDSKKQVEKQIAELQKEHKKAFPKLKEAKKVFAKHQDETKEHKIVDIRIGTWHIKLKEIIADIDAFRGEATETKTNAVVSLANKRDYNQLQAIGTRYREAKASMLSALAKQGLTMDSTPGLQKLKTQFANIERDLEESSKPGFIQQHVITFADDAKIIPIADLGAELKTLELKYETDSATAPHRRDAFVISSHDAKDLLPKATLNFDMSKECRINWLENNAKQVTAVWVEGSGALGEGTSTLKHVPKEVLRETIITTMADSKTLDPYASKLKPGVSMEALLTKLFSALIDTPSTNEKDEKSGFLDKIDSSIRSLEQVSPQPLTHNKIVNFLEKELKSGNTFSSIASGRSLRTSINGLATVIMESYVNITTKDYEYKWAYPNTKGATGYIKNSPVGYREGSTSRKCRLPSPQHFEIAAKMVFGFTAKNHSTCHLTGSDPMIIKAGVIICQAFGINHTNNMGIDVAGPEVQTFLYNYGKTREEFDNRLKNINVPAAEHMPGIYVPEKPNMPDRKVRTKWEKIKAVLPDTLGGKGATIEQVVLEHGDPEQPHTPIDEVLQAVKKKLGP